MSNITVYLFLLEHLPDFENILTLLSLTSDRPSQCDPIKSQIIWEHNINKSHTLKSITKKYISSEKIYNKQYEDKKTKLLDFNQNNEINKYPENPPFLVAIFESFFNITAQTCAGCLISSQYVLTASSCLDLLSYNIKNSTDKQKTSYTVIANANNPLIDGTVHNVTQVILNTNYIYLNKTLFNHTRKFPTITSNLVLMKIKPPVKVKSLHFFQNKAEHGLQVRIYGWTTTKDLSGQDIMKAVSFGAKVVNSKKCKTSKYLYEKYIVCLMAESNKYVNQINSGGPVVVYHRGTTKLLSVAEIRGTYVLAYTLKPYYNWIYNNIN